MATRTLLDRIRRPIRYWWQRRTRGWDDSDLWSLDYTLSKYLAPRLRRLRDYTHSHPCDVTHEEWQAEIDKMAAAFEWCGSDERWCEQTPEEVEQGLDLFRRRFFYLWD